MRKTQIVSGSLPVPSARETASPLTLLWNRINALLRYLTCSTLVPTKTATNTQLIPYANAPRNMLDNNELSALVDKTV